MDFWVAAFYAALWVACTVSACALLATVGSAVEGRVRRWWDRRRAWRAWRR